MIIILLGDLPSKDLDPDIRLYLKNHTYLSCDDKKFWDKLRYALPDVKVKAPIFRGTTGRSSTHHQQQQQLQIQAQQIQAQQIMQNGTTHRSMPPPPPPHYNQYPLPQPPLPQSQSQPQYHSPNLTSSHHHLLSSGNNSANSTLLAQQQQNMLNALNSGGVFLPNGMNLGSHHIGHMPPNIVPLGGGSGSGSGSLRSSQQRQYHTIVNSSLGNGGHPNNNRHNSAVHI